VTAVFRLPPPSRLDTLMPNGAGREVGGAEGGPMSHDVRVLSAARHRPAG